MRTFKSTSSSKKYYFLTLENLQAFRHPVLVLNIDLTLEPGSCQGLATNEKKNICLKYSLESSKIYAN